MFDGRLGAMECASTERHLKGCEGCRELLRELGSLQTLLRSTTSAPTPLEHQRARLALLRTGAVPVFVKRRRRPLLIAALVALPTVVWAASTPSLPLRAWLTSTFEPEQADGPATPAKPAAIVAKAAASELLREAAPATAQQPAVFESAPVASPTPVPASAQTLAHRAEAPVAARPSRELESAEAKHTTSVPRDDRAASRDFAEALAALANGAFGVSATQLQHFVTNYPGDARAEDASYLQAVALQRAGRIADAKAAALRYLASYPQGVHQEQARRISGRSLP
jgi:TolA-binding protein